MIHLDFGLHPHFLFFPNLEEYNCSNQSSEEWKKLKDPSTVCGLILLFIGLFAMGIYSVVITAMSNKTILQNDCIKLMYLYCWIDSGNVVIGGFMTAGLFFSGDIFCTNNFWTFAPGALGLGCWSASCVLCISLVLNRCLAFHRIEIGKFVHFVIFATFAHFIFMTLFTRPPVFNPTKGSWFFQPSIHSIAEEKTKFQNSYHLSENILTATLTPLLYAYLCIKMAFKPKEQSGVSKSFKKMQKSVFLQSLVVCLITSVTSFTFAYMQIFPYPRWWPFMAEVAYEVCGTLPAGVILILNPTIKRRAKMLFCRKKYPNGVSGQDGLASRTNFSSTHRSRIQPITQTNPISQH